MLRPRRIANNNALFQSVLATAPAFSQGNGMATIHATYEAGVFRPRSPVNLPEHCEVEFEPRVVRSESGERALDHIYGVLEERYQSGESDVAARHNEHQPDDR